MIVLKKLGRRAVGAILCVTMLLMLGSFAFAAEPHQDPETAEQTFSGIALLRYYSGALDFVIGKNPAEVETRLEKMPFANIPQSLEESANDFATSGISISPLIVALDEDMDRLRALIGQYSFEQAVELAPGTFAMLFQANNELERIEKATETTGEELEVFSVPAESDLKRAYDEVLEKIDRIREMLALYEELLKGDITLEEFLKTEITLEVQPITAFVGDDIHFKGLLTSEKEPLVGREVDILLNSSRYITVRTDAYGNYQGSLQVPYWYVPELDLQALYYPRGEDIGLYLSSLSPVIKLEVLYYQAELDIMLENQAYPGLETMIRGIFDYGQSPPPNDRKVGIYLDDVLITGTVTQESFTQEIAVPPETDVGKHVVTVSSAAVGGYSPVVASAVLNVTRVTPILDIDIPGVAWIPGSVELEGKLHSEFGPLAGSLIKMELGESGVEFVTVGDGSFSTRIKVGMGFGLVGSKDLDIQVYPQEPWHSPLDTARSAVMVNFVNCGILLAVIIFLGIFLPGRLRRLVVYPRRRARPEMVNAPPEPAPVYSNIVPFTPLLNQRDKASGESRNRIFFWYRMVVRLIQRISKVLLKPQQTLREFAQESSGVLGPARQYFTELTKTVEKLLYSKHVATDEDVEKSQRLSHTIEGELKG
jgi:hypothetical protein